MAPPYSVLFCSVPAYTVRSQYGEKSGFIEPSLIKIPEYSSDFQTIQGVVVLDWLSSKLPEFKHHVSVFR